MSLPPAKHFAWPVRVGVASCLTSLLTLVRNDDFNLAVTSVVFGVVVTIVAASDTLGATLATSWAIVGGATIGCVLSALCVALFGTSVAAVLVANALVGVAVLYPEKFPVVSQKFAFGGSTIFVWTAFAGADTRWMTLGIPLSTAIGACSAIIVTAFGKCNADDAVAAAADACAEAVADAAADAVAAYVADDVSKREALRARVESGRKDAERSLAKMKDAAAHAVWERRLTGALASVFATRSSRGGANGGGAGGEGGSAKKRAPEASAGAFAEVTLHLRGMTLALDALAETQVQRWHLLHEDPRDAGEPGDGARAKTFAEASFTEKLEDTAARVADAARAAATGFRPNAFSSPSDASSLRRDENENQDLLVAESLRSSLSRLDAALTRQRRKHYAPGGVASDAGESVARRALQANHLWMFNFQSLARELAAFLDPESEESGGFVFAGHERTREGRNAGGDEVLCEACGDFEDREEERRDREKRKPTPRNVRRAGAGERGKNKSPLARASSLPTSFAGRGGESAGKEPPRQTLLVGGDGGGDGFVSAMTPSPASPAAASAAASAAGTPRSSAAAASLSPSARSPAPRRAPPRFADPARGADTVAALLRCDFQLDANQLLYATKLSFAAAVAGLIGWATSGSGLWAAVTVAMVGTREGRAVGGSFNAALLRMQGTVIGAMFSFALVIVVTGGEAGATNALALGASIGRLLLLAAFAFASAFLRLNPEFAYAGVVAAFTAYVVALGIPDDADVAAARAFAHGRVEQNLLGLLVLVFVEFLIYPVFAHDAARLAAGDTVFAAKSAAETVYDATVGTDCARCRARAAEDAAFSLDAIGSCLAAQKALLVQAAAEPNLWSPPFPLRAHQQMVTDLENTRRVLGLMRKALGAMARSSRDAELSKDFSALDPRARIASLLAPTDVFVTELRRAVKTRLGRAGDDLVTGSGRWSSRAASASIAKAQSRLERAFILHTLAMRERYRAGETEMFLPNNLMVPWHAYVACTGILAATVESLGAASWDALLAVAEMDESEVGEAGEASELIDSERNRRDASFARRVSFGTERASSEGDARSSAVRAMRLKRDEVESEEPPFLGLREVRVEDEAVGTRL